VEVVKICGTNTRVCNSYTDFIITNRLLWHYIFVDFAIRSGSECFDVIGFGHDGGLEGIEEIGMRRKRAVGVLAFVTVLSVYGLKGSLHLELTVYIASNMVHSPHSQLPKLGGFVSVVDRHGDAGSQRARGRAEGQ